MHRVLRFLGWGLISAAALVSLFLFYQLFVTDFFNARSQAVASEELETVFRRPSSRNRYLRRPPPQATSEAPPAPDLVEEMAAPLGDPFGRITIDKIGLDAVIFEGVDVPTLKLGPGHMPGTPLPGQPGNAVLSGHRTTYGRPFFDLDQLVVGDSIAVETALGVNTYTIRDILVVAPTDVWVTDPLDGAWLTLTTCNPKFSAAERLIIQAELISGPNFDYVQSVTVGRGVSIG